MSDAIVIYDTETREVKVARFGDQWVVPARWMVFGGTIDEVNSLLIDDESGNTFFMPSDIFYAK